MFSLPVDNSILIFFIVLIVILFAPLLLNRLKIPSLIGLVIAGMLLGPNCFNVLSRDSSFEIFGSVGLLYIMFQAGLEMNMNDMRKNRAMSLVFGLLTFLIPMILGIATSMWLLKMNVVVATLLASMYASHTLLSYPIVSSYGINRERSVVATVGGTIITVLGALIILAVITGMYQGDIGVWFWVKLATFSLLIFSFILLAYPKLVRWFFKSYDDPVLQYIFVLSLVFLASYLTSLAGLEGIIGAFIAGLVLNRYIPLVSPLMQRIKFVGNALFIPYFLIGVGMLINIQVLFEGWGTLYVALVMTVVATLSKWIAALITEKSFRLRKEEGMMIFGLSNAQAAATLAAVMIGYNIITGYDEAGNAVRLLSEEVLNGTIVMILVTCAISSIYTQRAAKLLAMSSAPVDEKPSRSVNEKMLIPIANPDTIVGLVNFAVMMRSSKTRNPLFALSVVANDANDRLQSQAKKNLELAGQAAGACDVPMKLVGRIDMNVSAGVLNTMKERNISDVVIGLHRKANIVDSFFGTITEQMLKGTNKMLTVYKGITPINTTRKIVVAVPDKAEFELGFHTWLDRIENITKHIGCKVQFYATKTTIVQIEKHISAKTSAIRAEYEVLDSWDDLLLLTQVVEAEDLFILVSARHNTISYDSGLERLPQFMAKYFAGNNLVLIYPEQVQQITE